MEAEEEVPTPGVCANVVLTTVEPMEKTAHVKTIDPTSMDMRVLDGFLPVLFAYRLQDSSDAVYEEAVNRIKDGLRKVLVPFFPWAGRWIAVPGGKGRRLLCNDEGIPFIEAYVNQNLDSVVLISTDYQCVPELQGYSVLGMDPLFFRQPMLPEGLPCVFVQVTRFKCGGLVVAPTFNHMHADGKSFFDFMMAWSDFSRTGRTDMTMDPNRGAIEPFSQASVPPDFVKKSPPSQVWNMKCYEVSKSSIEFLKKEVNQGKDGAYISTIDCILAHLWKALAGLPFSITRGKQIGLLSNVEGRTRFYDPPLPNLLANVFRPMRMPNVPTADLVKMHASGIASKIREKIVGSTRESWSSDERISESMDVYTNDQVLPWVKTSWKSFPMYQVDFGFGTPIFAVGVNAPLTFNLLGGSYVSPPTPGVSSSAAFVYLRTFPEVLKAIEQHPDFLPLFLPKKGNLDLRQTLL